MKVGNLLYEVSFSLIYSIYMTVLFIWYTLAENIYLRSCPQDSRLPTCILIFKHLGLPKAVLFYSMQIISSSLKNFKRTEYLGFLIYTHYILAAFLTLLFFGIDGSSEFVYMSYFLSKTLNKERRIKSEQLTEKTAIKYTESARPRRPGRRKTTVFNPQSDQIRMRNPFRPINRLPQENNPDEPEFTSNDSDSKVKSRRPSIDNLPFRVKNKFIEKVMKTRHKEVLHDGSKRSIKNYEYSSKLNKITKDNYQLGNLDIYDELEDLVIPNEPRLIPLIQGGTFMPPKPNDIVQKTRGLSSKEIIVEEKHIQDEYSQLSGQSNNAVIDEFEHEENERLSDYNIPDPMNFQKKIVNKKQANSENEIIYKLNFSNLKKPKGNIKKSLYSTKKEDMYRKMLANVVFSSGKYHSNGNLTSQILEDLKKEDDLNMCDHSQKTEFQRLTDVDIFFLKNYFNMVSLKLDHHTFDFQEDMYRDDNNVFKRVRICYQIFKMMLLVLLLLLVYCFTFILLYIVRFKDPVG